MYFQDFSVYQLLPLFYAVTYVIGIIIFFRYYDGVVNAYDHVKGKHKLLYDDKYEEQLNLKKHRWELVDVNVLPDEVSKNEYNHCLLLYETQHVFVT
jgi:hypothetical protein